MIKKQPVYKKISWPELYFLAESSKESFKNVHLITAKAAFVDKISQAVYEKTLKDLSKRSLKYNIINIDHDTFVQNIKTIITSNARTRKIFVHEYVAFYPNYIEICINRERIDDDFIGEAINRLSTALEKLNGTHGVVTENKRLIFSLKEIPWLHPH